MKKLLMMIGAAVLAFSVNAASMSWKTYTGQYVYQSGTTTKLSGATAYLFDASVIAQSALLDGILNEGKAITSYTSLANATTTSTGAIAATDANPATGDITVYFAIVNGEDVFISSTVTGTVPETGALSAQFKGLNSPSKADAVEFASAASYTGAGWYTAVPEPTSGLLMLLGVAGLALRRRRA